MQKVLTYSEPNIESQPSKNTNIYALLFICVNKWKKNLKILEKYDTLKIFYNLDRKYQASIPGWNLINWTQNLRFLCCAEILSTEQNMQGFLYWVKFSGSPPLSRTLIHMAESIKFYYFGMPETFWTKNVFINFSGWFFFENKIKN